MSGEIDFYTFGRINTLMSHYIYVSLTHKLDKGTGQET